jgi:hypothetical protein
MATHREIYLYRRASDIGRTTEPPNGIGLGDVPDVATIECPHHRRHHGTHQQVSPAEPEPPMINRPSYAQRTLELTRLSLQRVPSHLRPTVSGTLLATERTSVELLRWRRKGSPHGPLLTE